MLAKSVSLLSGISALVSITTELCGMKSNISNLDRFIRLLIAVIAGVVLYTVEMAQVYQLLVLVVGIIAIGTALVNFCPLYRLLGISTRK